ncbi:trypsin-like peptidase domain-containing protein [bacterium SCSIO 12741]|nr:trypsin-like peptidase domain-containing protein [bacterium SCSIO 12741]
MKKIYGLVLALVASFSLSAQDLVALYEKVDPAVVVIYTEGKEALGGGSRLNQVSAQGLGSGVLIDSEKGLIMTAAHVVQGADKVQVEFVTGESIPATIVRSVPHSDVALIKLDWKPFKAVKAVPLGNSENVKVGEDIFIIGAPMGLEHSLSRGVISGRHYVNRVTGSGKKLEFFQTDASINQGNSGGPMFNMKGEVIGLVSYILTQSGGFEGIGFAASSEIASKMLLEENHFWTGLESVYVTDEIAAALNVPQPGGLLVQKVVKVSPTGRMGLQGGTFKAYIEGEEVLIGGDIILSVNGVPFTTEENLEKANDILVNLPPGGEFTLSVLRAGKIMDVKGNVPTN